ncbi:CAMK/CAMK1 protein kinase [Sphaeroforma arctica JP610]|uniref:CAMK/CAMK1 protein kinase n=1 Tax=Sphaeroforma arctica JP610 TaxID=667725 RepID=A0A0L0G478_9EUKA|nr:CAMK/CAMK1 protein kinase [Sphaeroforma arctica JP610]KNC83611.1 CAMK/CAMK1 protein kinase [Sphaeroforma arctica JP610]|eukprot:XP_014157513.1 CAMK/CAMK1 protein kinase [Sphaeroforma arctica JP610]
MQLNGDITVDVRALLQSRVKFTSISRDYTVHSKAVGKGRFAKVFTCTNKETGATHACKVIKKSHLPQQYDPLTEVEAHLMCTPHPRVVDVMAVYVTSEDIAIVMEFFPGGELFHGIVEQVYYAEAPSREIVRSLLSALLFLHANGVVHRDLKPENILISGSASCPSVSIADFGTAYIMKNEKDIYSPAWGFTLGYAAPELLEQGRTYGKGVDMWSLGVISYVLLCGYSPFSGDDVDELVDAIQSGTFEFDDEFFGDVSESAKDFITGCLQCDVNERLTAEEAWAHEWMTEEMEEDVGVHGSFSDHYGSASMGSCGSMLSDNGVHVGTPQLLSHIYEDETRDGAHGCEGLSITDSLNDMLMDESGELEKSERTRTSAQALGRGQGMGACSGAMPAKVSKSITVNTGKDSKDRTKELYDLYNEASVAVPMVDVPQYRACFRDLVRNHYTSHNSGG